MQYLALIYSTPNAGPQPESPEFPAYMAAWEKVGEAMHADSAFIAGEALQPVETATSVRVIDGKTELTDGPFAETKEQLGGFYMFEAENLDQAIKYAKLMPAVEHGTIEIRPIMNLDFNVG